MGILKTGRRRVTPDWAGMGRAWWVLFVLLFLGQRDLPAQTAPSSEYQLKAIFLFNFTQFVQWPAKAFPEPQAPLVIGVLGDDPFGGYLDAAVRGESVNTHSLTVQRYRRVEDIKECHLLFISSSESARMKEILTALKDRPILTVGDIESFSVHGGMVRFVIEKGKIRLRINEDRAKAADLTISSKLLRLAETGGSGNQ